MPLKKHIPSLLLYSRLVFVFIILFLSLYRKDDVRGIVLTLMYIGIISDIFDGIIARKLNVSTEKFRRLDTIFDLLFYFSILYFIFKTNLPALSENVLLITIILTLEGLMYFVSIVKFQKLPSPHAILSKFWGLYLVIEFSLLILGINGIHFKIALIIGAFVHIDRLLIYLLLKKWDHDIPSTFHAYQLSRGKNIRRNKLFNG